MSQLPKTILTTQLRTGAVLLSSLILAACATNDKPSYQLADIIKANPIDSTNHQQQGNPGATNPGATNPGTTNPGTTNPGTTNPGTTNPGATNPGTTNPGTTNPGTTNPGTTNPGTTNPGTTNPGTTNPGTTNPGTTNPGTTNPGTTNPGTTNPGTTNPGTTNPGTTNPGTTNPGTTNPGTTNPGTTNPGTTNPGTTNPGTTNPGTTNPGTTNPGTTNPGTTNPGATNPGTTNPGTTNPGTTNPGTTNPGTTNPGTTNPGTTNPGATNPGSSSPKNPDVPADTEMTGYQTITLSNSTAVGYNQFWDDKSDFTKAPVIDGNMVAIDNRQGNNFTSFNSIKARADMTKPSRVAKSADITLTGNNDELLGNDFYKHQDKTTVTVGLAFPLPLDLPYTSVYKNFDSQMQIGQVYGDITGLARVSGAYVQGHLTNNRDLHYLRATHNQDVTYQGNATYLEKLHLNDKNERGVLIGTSKITVNFPKNTITGELSFNNDGKQKYLPAGGKINFDALLYEDKNGFKKSNSQSNGYTLDVQGSFYGEDAKYVGGIYQDVLAAGGKGEKVGEGTRFQGTFGAVKQP